MRTLSECNYVLLDTEDYTFLFKPSNTLSSRSDNSWEWWDPKRCGLCHRIDKDANGINIIAKNNAALYYLLTLFKQRRVNKHYVSIVKGHIKKGVMIDRIHWNHNTQRAKVRPDGKICVSKIRYVKYYGEYSFICLKLYTGRRHQIRCQLANRGHPIVGDSKYGFKLWPNHMFLNALAYGFRGYNGEIICYCMKVQKLWMEFLRIVNR